MSRLVLSLFLVLILGLGAFGQRKTVLDGEILIKHKFKRFRGVVVDSNSHEIKMFRLNKMDTVSVSKENISHYLTNRKVTMFNNEKYYYKSGFQFTYSLGFFDGHFQNDFSILMPISEKITFGIGAGVHFNETFFHSAVAEHSIGVNSTPIFAYGQYFFNKGINRFFVDGRLGYSYNLETNQITSVNNGVMMELGLGVRFSTKHRIRHSISLSQYSTKAKGTALNTNEFAKSDISFDLWFNTLAIKYKLIIGR